MMNKKLSILLAVLLLAALLAGCAGTPVVYYGNCTCPTGSHDTPPEPSKPQATGSVRTGLAVVTSVKDSVSGEKAAYDVTLVAVTVDDMGKIQDCVIDGVSANIAFDAAGAITSDLTAPIQTKNELGDEYGMKLYGGAKYEWYEQAAALARYAVGKTVEELKNGAIDETGKAPAGSDLASTATIYLGGYVSAIEEAVKNAKHMGANAGDELRLSAICSAASSVSATADKAGTAQLDSDVTAVTVKDGVITSCVIDSVQAKVTFDTTGTITSDIASPVQTKTQLGDSYGMVAWGGAQHEWYEQAAAFANYVVGKTPAQVADIAVSEGKPADADLSASVTIAIGGFQALIAKATAR